MLFPGILADGSLIATAASIRTSLGLGTADNPTFANLTVSNLTVNGTATTVNSATITVDDPLIRLGDNNAADTVDLGWYGLYVSSGSKYTGIFRDATDGKFKIFTGLQEEPSTTVNVAGTGYTGGTLVLSTVEAAANAGLNVAGSNLILAPGSSTGNATPASVTIRSTVAGVSSSNAQTLIDTVTVTNGRVRLINPLNTATWISFEPIASDGRMRLVHSGNSSSAIEFWHTGALSIPNGTITLGGIQGGATGSGAKWYGSGPYVTGSNNLYCSPSSNAGANATITLRAERYADTTANGQPSLRIAGKTVTIATGSPDSSLTDVSNRLNVDEAGDCHRQGLSSTSTLRNHASWNSSAIDNTDATRKYRSTHLAWDTAAREYARGWGDGTVGRIAVAAPASAPTDAHLGNGQISFYLDETGHNLLIRAKYSGGTLKLATIALA